MKAKRSGSCICGIPLAEHFDKRNRKRDCAHALRLSVMNRPPDLGRKRFRLVVGNAVRRK